MQAWDGSWSGQLGTSPLWWESQPSPQNRHVQRKRGRTCQAADIAEVAGEVAIKHLCHEPVAQVEEVGVGVPGATALPVWKEAWDTELSLLCLWQMDILNDHGCIEERCE